MGLQRISAPGIEPITRAEAKLHANIDQDTFDSVVDLLIAAARRKAENYTGTAIMTQTWVQTLDAFPAAEIELLKPPVASITSVKYRDETGAEQTLGSSLYRLDTATFPGWLLPAYGSDWPTTEPSANAVSIECVCGYASAAAVPEDMKAWLLMTFAFMWANRESFVLGGKVAEIPARFMDTLLDPYRVFKA